MAVTHEYPRRRLQHQASWHDRVKDPTKTKTTLHWATLSAHRDLKDCQIEQEVQYCVVAPLISFSLWSSLLAAAQGQPDLQQAKDETVLVRSHVSGQISTLIMVLVE